MKADTDDDFRYPITVFLVRENRPKYWEFHCPFCTATVCELDGSVVQLRDISNNSDASNNSSTRIRCPGTNKKWCRMWFEFTLSN